MGTSLPSLLDPSNRLAQIVGALTAPPSANDGLTQLSARPTSGPTAVPNLLSFLKPSPPASLLPARGINGTAGSAPTLAQAPSLGGNTPPELVPFRGSIQVGQTAQDIARGQAGYQAEFPPLVPKQADAVVADVSKLGPAPLPEGVLGPLYAKPSNFARCSNYVRIFSKSVALTRIS